MLSNIHILKNILYNYFIYIYNNINNKHNESTLIFMSKQLIMSNYMARGELLSPCYSALLHKIKTLITRRITCKKRLVDDKQYDTLKKLEIFEPTYIVSTKSIGFIFTLILNVHFLEKLINISEEGAQSRSIKESYITLTSTKLKLPALEDFIKLCTDEHKLYKLSLDHKQNIIFYMMYLIKHSTNVFFSNLNKTHLKELNILPYQN